MEYFQTFGIGNEEKSF